MKWIEITLAITNFHCYGITDTSCGPKQTFLLFYSCYNGHYCAQGRREAINIGGEGGGMF